MKYLILISAALFSLVLHSQNSKAIEEEPTFYISLAQDVKMSFEGPHGGGGVLNPEVVVGFNINPKNRVWMGYEWLSQIDYRKFTFAAYDRTFPITERFNIKGGIEFSIIYREKVNPNDIWFGYEHDNLSVGYNGEFAYRISRTFEVFLNGSVFLAEPHDNMGNEMKLLRTDVRFGFNIIIFKVP